jgi:hypothetical protein
MTATARRRRAVRALAGAAALAATITLSGCSDNEQSGVAATAPDDEGIAFVDCIREQGVDMPDPGPGDDGLREALRAAMGEYDEGTLRAAMDTCQPLMPGDTSQRAEMDEEDRLALAECLRDQGLDVDDDLFEGQGMPEGISRDELRTGMEECRDPAADPMGGGRQ